MRKELTVYVNTIEKGEEFSIMSVKQDRGFVIINSGGNKFTANVQELEDALKALKEFNEVNVQETKSESTAIVMSYGDDQWFSYKYS